MQPLKILFLSCRGRPLRQGRRPGRRVRLAAQGARRPGPRRPRRHAGLRADRGGPAQPASTACAPHPVTLQVPMGGGAVPAGVLEATLPGSEVPVYFIAERHRFGDRPFFYGYRRRPVPLRLLQPGGPRPGDRRPRLAARRGPRPRLARRAGHHLAGHRRPARRPLRRPADRLHHPQPDAPGHRALGRASTTSAC